MFSSFLQRLSTRLVLAVMLGAILYLAYLLVFSGGIISNDERYIIDTTDTLVNQDNPYLNQTTYIRGLQRTDVEPAQPVLAVPLYWIAYHIPWIGTIHGTFLFAPIVTALTALVLFFFVLDLDYRQTTAIWVSLLFGLTTIAVPYAQTFFREPLAAFTLIATAYTLNRWRQSVIDEKRHWPYLVAAIVLFSVSILTKEAALIALPGLLAFAYPGRMFILRNRKLIIGILITLLVFALIFISILAFVQDAWVILAGRYEIENRLDAFWAGLPGAWFGMSGYLLSPGKSVWFFSPITILALAAPAVNKRRQWRVTWLPLAMTLWFALCYGAIRREIWYGGADWGSRYMVPMIPFLMLAVAPVLEKILDSRLWIKIATGLLGLFGLLVQIGATYVNLHAYYGFLQENTGQPPWGQAGIWNPRWSQAIGSILYIPQADPNILWFIPDPDWLTFAVIGAAFIGLIALLWWVLQTDHLEKWPYRGALLLSPLLAVIVTLLALGRNYSDPRYLGQDEELHTLRQHLEASVVPDDLVLLSSPNYVLHFMNYYKGSASWYSLPLAPGERYSPDDELIADNAEGLIVRDGRTLVNMGLPGRLLHTGETVWMVLDHSSYISWATRPYEWYLAENSFPIQSIDFGPTTRLVQFAQIRAPVDTPPTITNDVYFGSSIHLIGHDVVTTPINQSASDLHPGSNLGISLAWETSAPLDQGYVSAMFIVNANGEVILQQDRPPQGGFRPTTSWQPGEVIRDNFGFILPDDLPPGTYQVWSVLYSWPSIERLPVTDAQGETIADHVVVGSIEVKP